jgi:hypothetical protein
MILDAAAIQEKIANLTRERDGFITEANLRVAQFNGAISAYQSLLNEMEETADVGRTAENPPGAK